MVFLFLNADRSKNRGCPFPRRPPTALRILYPARSRGRSRPAPQADARSSQVWCPSHTASPGCTLWCAPVPANGRTLTAAAANCRSFRCHTYVGGGNPTAATVSQSYPLRVSVAPAHRAVGFSVSPAQTPLRRVLPSAPPATIVATTSSARNCRRWPITQFAFASFTPATRSEHTAGASSGHAAAAAGSAEATERAAWLAGAARSVDRRAQGSLLASARFFGVNFRTPNRLIWRVSRLI